jgi:hypothetical protein
MSPLALVLGQSTHVGEEKSTWMIRKREEMDNGQWKMDNEKTGPVLK